MTTCPRCGLKWGQSDDERGLLFGVISMAFDNWPESHPYQPPTSEHLRGWLALRVNHLTVVRIPRARGLDRDGLRRIADIFSEDKIYYEANATKSEIEISVPRTMKKALPIKEFRPMACKIYEIIEQATGISPEVYKHNKDKAA